MASSDVHTFEQWFVSISTQPRPFATSFPIRTGSSCTFLLCQPVES